MKTTTNKNSSTPSVVPPSSAAVGSGFTLGLDLGEPGFDLGFDLGATESRPTGGRRQVGQTFLSAGAGAFQLRLGLGTGDWKVPSTRRLESLRYAVRNRAGGAVPFAICFLAAGVVYFAAKLFIYVEPS